MSRTNALAASEFLCLSASSARATWRAWSSAPSHLIDLDVWTRSIAEVRALRRRWFLCRVETAAGSSVCVLREGSIRMSEKAALRLESSVLENQFPNSTMVLGQVVDENDAAWDSC